jgi:enterochelin esterase-like enzyme
MKKNLSYILFFLLNSHLYSQIGQVHEFLTLKSNILGMDRKFAVYLPPDYNTSERMYPVLYLLHGMGEDHNEWIQCGEIQNTLDRFINSGKVTPMIVIMPDANTGKMGYTNDAAGNWRYEDFFFEELMPFVEKKYRIRREKRFRAISGLSMGGGGTFIYALHRPDLFIAACPLSAAARPAENTDWKKYVDKNIKPDADESQILEWEKKYNIHNLINAIKDEEISSVKWFIDCGDDDFLYEGNSLIHIQLRKRNIPHEFRVRNGSHDWTYWRESLPEVLHFISIAFHQGID